MENYPRQQRVNRGARRLLTQSCLNPPRGSVAAALTDADRAKLLEIKQGIEKAGKS